jgi:hypothetical protein
MKNKNIRKKINKELKSLLIKMEVLTKLMQKRRKKSLRNLLWKLEMIAKHLQAPTKTRNKLILVMLTLKTYQTMKMSSKCQKNLRFLKHFQPKQQELLLFWF